ncbi:MAG TPA: DNA recombination protein RmuC [Steroidobacteraceae bacterium]|nr:DNA recombination protein RmuC [Steroidobacteraceae bacterium]
MSGAALLWGAVALLAGFALGWLVSALRAQNNEKRLSVDLEVTRSQLQTQQALEEERGLLIERAQERLKNAFDTLATESLRSNSELFLKLARENLGQQQLQALHSLKEREQAIETLLAPIRDALKRTEVQISTIEKDRHEAFGAIRQHLESVNLSQSELQRETRNLVNALRRPEVRGQWGELSLRRLVELAGMTVHCDFTEQVHTTTDEGALRPDLIVHMVDGRDLVVDVKTPLTAYLEAVEAQSDEARAAALRRHGQLVAERVRALASKAYWAQFAQSPDFAILFLPGDQFLAAAMNENPALLDEAIRQGVIIATPTSFIAMLKAIAYGWRQLALAQNAATIRDLGQELYKRLSVFGSHLARIGAALDRGVDAYNNAVGSLERQVLPAARRFTELGLSTDRPLEEPQRVDRLARDTTPSNGGKADEPPAG